MQKIIDYTKQYIGVISIVLAICILLVYSFSYFKVNIDNKRAAEMYIGELKYSIEIDGNITNTLTVPAGETIVTIKISNLNPVDTYYKLLYLNNSNLTVEYFDSAYDLDDSNNIVNTYDKTNDSIVSNNSKTIKLKIKNNSASDETLNLSVKGGYITNTINDITASFAYSEITAVDTKSSTYFCKTDKTLKQGLQYTNDQYTYAYMQEGVWNDAIGYFYNMSSTGWGVMQNNKTTLSNVTSKICTYINDIPIVSMSYMYAESEATSIDLSSINTLNVINMQEMFNNSAATILDLSNFDTKNVTNMSSMFYGSSATSFDLSNFNTSNVTNMKSMFRESAVTTLDLSSFNTSNVTNMTHMFQGSAATTIKGLNKFNTSNVTDMAEMFFASKVVELDVSSFDTRNVTDMRFMFCDTNLTSLNLSNFDTSKVTNMSYMFNGGKVTSLDLSSFDTSNVTDMEHMFSQTKIKSLDLSNFNTSNVTNMNSMFYESQNLTTIYVSNKFVTNNVTYGDFVFYSCTNLVGGSGTKYNASFYSGGNYADIRYARIDGGTGSPGYFTLKN